MFHVGGNFVRQLLISSLSNNPKYIVWNSNVILTYNAILLSSRQTSAWLDYNYFQTLDPNPFQQFCSLAGDPALKHTGHYQHILLQNRYL